MLLVTLLGSQKKMESRIIHSWFVDEADEFSVEMKEIKNQQQPTKEKWRTEFWRLQSTATTSQTAFAWQNAEFRRGAHSTTPFHFPCRRCRRREWLLLLWLLLLPVLKQSCRYRFWTKSRARERGHLTRHWWWCSRAWESSPSYSTFSLFSVWLSPGFSQALLLLLLPLLLVRPLPYTDKVAKR